MTDSSRTVVVSNVYADDNRGGAAITEMAVRLAHDVVPGCQVSLIAVSPRRDRYAESYRFTLSSCPDVSLIPPPLDVRHGTVVAVLKSLAQLAAPRRIGRRDATVRRIAGAALVMSKGGQAFRDVPTRNLLSFYATVLPLLIAQRAGRPTAVVATSLGPFTRSWPVRALAGVVLRRCTVVLARGRQSAAVAARLGVAPERIVVVPDSVFAYGAPDPVLVSAMLEQYNLAARRFAVVTLSYVMDGPGRREAVFRSCVGLMRRALDEGLIDKVVVALQVHGGTSDLGVTKDFLAYASDPRFLLVDDDLSPAQLMALYAGASATIGGRLHAAIFSLVAGTPGFPLQIDDPKPEEVFDMVGRRNWVLHPLRDSVDDMYRRLREAIVSNEVRESLATAMKTAAIEASTVETHLAAAVRGDGRN